MKRINYKKYEKESIILTVSFELENVPFNIKSSVLNAMIAMHVHKQLCLIILLLGIREKVNTGELFFFCKKYGLFNGFIFLTVKKFLLSYFPNFHGHRSGGGGGGGAARS